MIERWSEFDAMTQCSLAPIELVRRIIASRDGGFSSSLIARGDFYVHWHSAADTSGSTPQFCGGKPSNYIRDLSKRLRMSGAVNVCPLLIRRSVSSRVVR